MKRYILMILMLVALLALAGCSCNHEWNSATCTEAKRCRICGQREGEALGHSYGNAGCETPKACQTCGQTEGEPTGHQWVDATCENPQTCAACGETKGERLSHEWKPATCARGESCDLCGKCNIFCPADARKVCGKSYTVEKVFSSVVKDRMFYETSGGGVTFSGGECTYCGHCKPCPAGIDIAMVNKLYDLAVMQPEVPASLRQHYLSLDHHAEECIACRGCESRCPFGVKVAGRMARAAELFEG